jgi:hypothetical protein
MKKQSVLIISLGVVVVLVVVTGQLFFSKKADVQLSTSEPQALISIQEEKSTPFPTVIHTITPVVVTGGPSPTPPKRSGDVVAILDFGNNQQIRDLVYAQNALEALQELVKGRSLAITVKEYKYGKLVEKIGDKANDSEHFWAYYVNGELGNVAGDKFIVHPKDAVQWKYEKVNK